jgi:uncharacterized membrane protein YgdD (TMEM256/DUF423 family)
MVTPIDVLVFRRVVHTLINMNTTTRWITLAAGLIGFTGVALGAFGAHALKATLIVNGTLETWKTAVLYQLVHAVALLALAGWRDSHAGPSGKVAACWIAGIVLFSGSLYLLALGGPRFLGPITPLGGLAFMAGWLWLVLTAWKKPAA